MLKKIILIFLVLGVVLSIAKSPYLQDTLTQGTAPLVDRVRSLIDQSAGESLMDRIGATMKVDTQIQRLRKSLRRDPEKRKEFFWLYCDTTQGYTPRQHKELSRAQQEDLCEDLRE
jgi:hypothetical protein